MSEFWQLVQHRGQQTIGVWSTHAATLTVGDDTLATHTSVIDSLPDLAQARANQEDAVDTAINARDAARALIRDLYVRVPRKIEGDIPGKDPFHKDIAEIRTIDPESMDAEVVRGQRVVALWKKYNARRAAATPPKTAFLVGGTDVDDLTDAMESLPTQTQAIETERSKLNDKRNDLRAASDKGHDVNIRWFGVWEGEFLPETNERKALSQIDTGDVILPPTVLEIAGLAHTGSGVVTVTHAETGGAHGTVFRIEWKQEGEDWSAATGLNLVRPATEVPVGTLSGVTLIFRNRVSNSQGTVFSAEQSIILP